MKITLIRHTSVAVEPGICYGWTDVELAASFHKEATQTQESICNESFDAIFSSPLSRCRKLAAFCGYAEPFVDDRLKELNFGCWEMKKWEEISDSSLNGWYHDWINQPAGGAESYKDQCKRIADFLDEIKNQDIRHACIFTHRGVIASALVYAGIWTMEDSFSVDVPYGSRTDLDI